MKKTNFGFTFVELIIVLVILTILATIGFTVYESYLGTGRDTKRIADLRGLQQSLSTYALNSKLPLPEDSIEISSGTNTLSYHGDITDTIAKQAGFKGEIYDKEFNMYPIYVLSENRKDFQLMSFLEDRASMMTAIPRSYAFIDYQQLFSTTIGKPLGVFLDDELSEPIHRMQEYSGDDSYDILSGTGAFEIVMSDVKKIFTESGGNISQIIPNQSCKRILEMGKSQGSGVYTISPTGSGSVRVYCDMRTDGGGWTILVNNDNKDDESLVGDCKPRLSGFLDHSCGSIQASSDFVVNAQGIFFNEFVFAGYQGIFENIVSYQYMKWNDAQKIPNTSTFETDTADSWDNSLGGFESKGNLRCNNGDPQYVTLHNGSGPFEPHTAIQDDLSGAEREFSFIDNGNSTLRSIYGLDDYQDGDGCTDDWGPKEYRGYSAYIMVR